MTQPLNIAMIAACPFPYPRGTPVRILRMSEALAKNGHNVTAVTYHLGRDDEDLPFDLVRTPGVPTYRKVSPGPSWQKLAVVDPLLVAKLRGVLRRRSIDLIHAHHYEGLLVALAATVGRKTPIVFDAHTLLDAELHYYGMGLVKSVKNRVARWFDNTFPRRANHVVTVTDSMRDRLIETYNLDADRVTAVINGVELDHFDLTDKPRPDKPNHTLIFTGNLAAYQGVGDMLEAFALLRERRGDVRLLVASGDNLSEYQTQIDRLKLADAIDLEPAGFKELPGLLHGADLALNPRSAMDGIPQKLLNYMAAGKTVVSFDGSSKILEHEKTGWIVPDGDVAAMADAIDKLLGDDALRLSIAGNALDYARQHLSWDRVARRLDEVYAAVLDPTGKPLAGPALS